MIKLNPTIFLTILCIVSILVLSSCTFILFNVLSEYYGDDKYETVRIGEPTFVLAWDTDDPSVHTYRLFYKILNKSELVELEQISIEAADDIRIEIDSSQFVKNTPIVLGVAAVSSQGDMSEIHFSTDNSAIPKGGWILQVE